MDQQIHQLLTDDNPEQKSGSKIREKYPDDLKLKKILKKLDSFPPTLQTSPSLLHNKARILDVMAHRAESNTLLEQSIEAFVKVLSLGGSTVAPALYKKAAERCSELMEFR